MSKEVAFNIKLNIGGKEHLVTAAADMKVLSGAIRDAQTSAANFRDKMLAFTQAGVAIQQAVQGVQQITSQMLSYSSAYNEDIEAAAKLANAMRNTMSAREDEIQSIKDLCAAQQALGVVGDETQLSGAQELATYLTKKESLEKLIPVMNDMIAQQYGLKATQEGAVSVAVLLGKVMQGQVAALSRYGYRVSEAQKKTLELGTEEERVAAVIEMVSSQIGGMNAELARSDAGRAKQMANAIGDMKEQIGGMYASFAPAIQAISEAGTALLGFGMAFSGFTGAGKAVARLIGSITKLKVVTHSVTGATRLAQMAQTQWANTMRYLTQAQIQWSNGARIAAIRTLGLKVALRGLLISTGVGAAIAAVTALVSAFSDKAGKAVEKTDELAESTEAYNSAGAQAKVEIDAEIRKLGTLIKTKGDTTRAVAELNEKYKDSFGTYKTAAAWYDVLIKKSKDYIKQKAYEGVIQDTSSKLGKSMLELDKLEEAREALRKSGKDREMVVNYEPISGAPIYSGAFQDTREAKLLDAQIKEKRKEVAGYTKEVDNAQAKVASLLEGLRASADVTFNKSAASIKDLEDRIDELKGRVKSLGRTKEDNDKAAQYASEIKMLEAEKAALEKLRGLSKEQAGANRALVADPQKIQDISNNIDLYKKKLTGKDTEEQRALIRKIQLLEDERRALELLNKEAERPLKLNSLGDLTREIEFQNHKYNSASSDTDRAVIKKRIEELEALKQAKERASFTSLPLQEIDTYEQLNAQIAHYTSALQVATSAERATIQEKINRLEDLKKTWDKALNSLKAPADISALNNISELEEAIAYYQEQQKQASADEYAALQRTINALREKQNLITRGAELADMQAELDRLAGMSKKELRIHVRGMGFDKITEEIARLQGMLRDTKNPLTEEQSASAQSLIVQYQALRGATVSFADGARSAWSGVSGMVGGIESMSQALERNGNAWQKLSGFVQSFFSIVEGVSSVVRMVQMLTAVTQADTVATGINTVAKTANTTATVANATAKTAAEGATTAVEIAEGVATATTAANIVAIGLETKAFMKLAAAKFMAAHAYIPFAGYGIGAGFTAAMAALVQGIGVIPFAKGGIVSGPTLALVGEYGGATNNPEVIAPLDKLRAMIEPSGGIGGKVEFKIQGRTLVGVLANEQNIRGRS